MDPTANLQEQLRISARLQECRDRDIPTNPDDVDRLAELVQGLHTWISRGGALPMQWTRPLPV